MNKYQFEQIIRRSAQRFGKMKRREEEQFTADFFVIESNMIIVHREHPKADGIRAREAVMLVLHHIEGLITGEEKDLSAFENEENRLLADAILYAIDPQFSDKGMTKFKDGGGDESKLDDPEYLMYMYLIPVQCLLRIIDSIDLCTRKMGSNGYFTLIEKQIGPRVADEFNLCLTVPDYVV